MGMRVARCGWCGKRRHFEGVPSDRKGQTTARACGYCVERGVVERAIVPLFEKIRRFAEEKTLP